MTDLTDAIEENASQPKKVQIDGNSVEQHSIADQIAADEHIQNQRARNRTTLPIFKTKILPGGPV